MRNRRPLLTSLAALVACGCTYVDPEVLPGAPLPERPTAAQGLADDAARIAAPKPGSLLGVLRGPAAGLIGNHAAGLVGNNAAGLIGNHAAGLVGNNAAGVVSNHAAGLVAAGQARLAPDRDVPGRAGTAAPRFGLLARADAFTAPVPSARVSLYDDTGARIGEEVTTDAEGRFRFEGIRARGRVLFLRAHYRQEGHDVALAATASVPMAGEDLAVAIDPATTLVTHKMTALLSEHRVDVARLQPAEIAQIAAALAEIVDAREVVAAAILPPARVAAEFDRLSQAHAALTMTLRKATDEGPAGMAASGPAGTVATIAGGEGPGYVDGPGDQARFAHPQGLALDPQGRLYVADYNNHCIRRVATDGTVATIAGNGEPGEADGPGAEARFRHPRGLAWHGGALYAVDSGNRCVRKLVPAEDGTWTVSRVAVASGPALVDPRGLAADAAGALYIADGGALRVVRIAEGAAAIAAELPATGTSAQLAGPFGVAVDAAGTLFVADATSNAIRAFPRSGPAGTLAGSGTVGLMDGKGPAARFAFPAALGLDPEGDLVVADALNHAVRRVSPTGDVVTLAGAGVAGGTDGSGAEARFFRPGGVAVAADGTVFVADTENHRIRRITAR